MCPLSSLYQNLSSKFLGEETVLYLTPLTPQPQHLAEGLPYPWSEEALMDWYLDEFRYSMYLQCKEYIDDKSSGWNMLLSYNRNTLGTM